MRRHDLKEIFDRALKEGGCVRVGITGSHRVGKTVLAKKLANIFGFTYIPEFARELINATGYNWTEGDWYVTYFEEAIFACYNFVHRYLSDTSQGFITDRTFLDIAAYCLWHILKGKALEDDRFLAFYGKLINTLRDSAHWYDIVLFYRTKGLDVDSCQAFIDAAIQEFISQYWGNTAVVVVEICRGDELRVAPNKYIGV